MTAIGVGVGVGAHLRQGVGSGSSGPADTILTGLVSAWRFEEPSGTRYDAYGTNHLQDLNTVTQVAGIQGNAAQFTRANSESLYINDNPSITLGDIDVTFDIWFRFDTKPGVMSILGSWEANTTQSLLFFYNSGTDRMNLLIGGGNTTAATVVANAFGSPPLNTWIHALIWHDAVNNIAGIRINDQHENTAATSGPMFDPTTGFRFGANAFGGTPTNFLNGRLDEPHRWNRLLTASEKTWLYNAGAGRVVFAERTQFVFHGNSIFAQIVGGTVLLPDLVMAPLSTATYEYINSGAGGFTTVQLGGRATVTADPFYRPGRKDTLIFLEVGNHLFYEATKEEAWAAVVQFCADRRAAGVDKIVLCTCPPRTSFVFPDAATFEVNRTWVNDKMRTEGLTTAGADAIVDFDTNPMIATVNTTNYPDLVHPSNATKAAMADMIRPVMLAV